MENIMERVIRQSSNNNEYFALAEFDKKVHIYSSVDFKYIKSLNTHLDYGGSRLQIIPEFNLIITGSYERFGIECYNISTGEMVWNRKDLKKVQKIRLDSDYKTISCFFDNQAGQKIDVINGITLSKYKNVTDVFSSQYEELSLLIVKKYEVYYRDKLVASILPESWAVSFAYFTNDKLAISEYEGVFRIFSLKNYDKLGSYYSPKGSHILSFIFDSLHEKYICFEYQYKDDSRYYIVHIDINGDEKNRFEITNGYNYTFFSKHNLIVNAKGDAWNYITGEKFERLVCIDI